MSTQRARDRCVERVGALIGQGGDPFTVQVGIVGLLRPVIGFDRWCWPSCDPGSGRGTTAVGDHDYWGVLPRLLLLDQRLDQPGALPGLTGPRARSARDPGLRFTDVLGPVGIGDELRLPLRDRHGLWGCLDLMRSTDERPFAEEELELLDVLRPMLAAVTRQSSAAAAAARGADQSPPPSAGVFVLDCDLDVRASTPGARAWVRQLVPLTFPFANLAAMGVIYNVASRVLARAAADRWSSNQSAAASQSSGEAGQGCSGARRYSTLTTAIPRASARRRL